MALAGAVLAATILLAPAPPGAGAGDATAWFEQGLERFGQARTFEAEHPAEREEITRRYRAARDSFLRLWREGIQTTEVLTNIANASYFAGDAGEAVLFYRRAILADPGNRRALDSLEFIRSTLPFRRAEWGARATLTHSLFFWHYGTRLESRKIAFMIAFPLGWLALLASLRRRQPFLIVGVLLLLASTAILISLLAHAWGAGGGDDAVVIVQVRGRRGDGEAYSPSHDQPFPPGTEVTVLEGRRNEKGPPWINVRLPDGSDAWIPPATVEMVVPGAGG